MNNIPTQWAFEPRAAHPLYNPHPTNDVLPTLPALARQLVRLKPWLANRPELVPGTPLAAMEWPDHAGERVLREWPDHAATLVAPTWPTHAAARFNKEVIDHRVAEIGTALTQPHPVETAVGHTLRQAHFYALLQRHQGQPLQGNALDTARALYETARRTPLGNDHTPMGRWLDMRPHFFGKTARTYGDAMVRWAEGGIPQEAFYYDGAAR